MRPMDQPAFELGQELKTSYHEASPLQQKLVRRMLLVSLRHSGWKATRIRPLSYYSCFFGYKLCLDHIQHGHREVYLQFKNGFWMSLKDFDPSIPESEVLSKQFYQSWKYGIKFDHKQAKLRKTEWLCALEAHHGWEGSSLSFYEGDENATRLPINLYFARSRIPDGTPYRRFPVKNAKITIPLTPISFRPDSKRVKPAKLSGKIVEPLSFWSQLAPNRYDGLGMAHLIGNNVDVYIVPWDKVPRKLLRFYLAVDSPCPLPFDVVKVQFHKEAPIYEFSSAPFLSKVALIQELDNYYSSGDHGNSYRKCDVFHPVFKMWCSLRANINPPLVDRSRSLFNRLPEA